MPVRTILTNPYLITFVAYLLTYALHAQIIVPLESLATGTLASFASLLFLPHAVRVLSVWMLGPKALIGLLPAHLLVDVVRALTTDRELFDAAVILAPVVASCSAVLAFELLKVANINLYVKYLKHALSWRVMMLIGAVASVFNSIGLTLVYQGHIDQASMYKMMTNYLIGDVLGLFLGLLILMFFFRWLKLTERAFD